MKLAKIGLLIGTCAIGFAAAVTACGSSDSSGTGASGSGGSTSTGGTTGTAGTTGTGTAGTTGTGTAGTTGTGTAGTTGTDGTTGTGGTTATDGSGSGGSTGAATCAASCTMYCADANKDLLGDMTCFGCVSAAFNGNTCSQTHCLGETDCYNSAMPTDPNTFRGCIATCTDAACFTACEQKSPTGASAFAEDVAACGGCM